MIIGKAPAPSTEKSFLHKGAKRREAVLAAPADKSRFAHTKNGNSDGMRELPHKESAFFALSSDNAGFNKISAVHNAGTINLTDFFIIATRSFKV